MKVRTSWLALLGLALLALAGSSPASAACPGPCRRGEMCLYFSDGDRCEAVAAGAHGGLCLDSNPRCDPADSELVCQTNGICEFENYVVPSDGAANGACRGAAPMCDDGLECDAGYCEPAPAEGSLRGACHSSAPYCDGASLLCDADLNKCVSSDGVSGGSVGQACRDLYLPACDGALECNEQRVCAVPPPADGAFSGACRSQTPLCDASLVCSVNDNTCVNATSAPGGAQGQACREDQFIPRCDGALICQEDSTCQNEGYIVPGSRGGACRNQAGVAACDGDLVCNGQGVCAVAPPPPPPPPPANGTSGGACRMGSTSVPLCDFGLVCAVVANATCVNATSAPGGAQGQQCRSQAFLPRCDGELSCYSDNTCQIVRPPPPPPPSSSSSTGSAGPVGPAGPAEGSFGGRCHAFAPYCDGPTLVCAVLANRTCVNATSAPGGAQGQACRSDMFAPRCNGELICQPDNTCQPEGFQPPAGSLGGQCRFSLNGTLPCDGNLTCANGLCVQPQPQPQPPKGPTPGAMGGACLAVFPFCYDSLACLVANQTCALPPAFPAGSMNNPCRSVAFAPRCEGELICQANGVCQPEGYKPEGGEGQNCRRTVPQCDGDLQCQPASNMCARPSKPAAGSLGGACRPSFNGTLPCDRNLTCTDGLCMPLQPPPVTPVDPCSKCGVNQNCFSGKCFDKPTACVPECKVGYLCMNGTCIVTGGSTDGKCTTNAMCGGRKCNAATGACEDWPMPALDCGGSCPVGQECRLGACIAKQTTKACMPACNAAWGQSCNSVAGVCVSGGNVTCVDCSGGVCERPVAPNMPPTCLQRVQGAPNSCGGAGDASCPTASYCRSGVCVACTGACQLLASSGADAAATQSLMTTLVSGGINPASITAVQTPASVQAALSSTGKLTFQPGTLMQIDSSVSGVKELVMSASAESAARVSGDHALQSMQVTGSSSKIVLEGGKLATQELSIGSGGALTISVPSGQAPVLNMSSLSLNGALNLVGGQGVQLVLPATAAGVSVGAGAAMSLSGGSAVVSGFLGSTPITLSSGASLSTAAGQQFVAAGPLLGDGELAVAGLAVLSGSTVEVSLQLSPGGTLAIDTSAALASGSGAQTLADIDFAPGASSTMELRGSATSGSNLFVSELKSCPAGAMMRYRVSGDAQAAVDGGMTFFNYGAATFGNAASFVCDIEVCGSTGPCIVIRNPNVPVTAGRRLLADSVTATASFEPTKLSVSGKGASGAGNAAAALNANPVLLALLALAAAFVAMRR